MGLDCPFVDADRLFVIDHRPSVGGMMNAKRLVLVLLGIAVSLLLLAGTSRADGVEGYCCVCTGCSAGKSQQCISVLAPGFQTADCANRCSTQNCQFLEVLEGSCSIAANVVA